MLFLRLRRHHVLHEDGHVAELVARDAVVVAELDRDDVRVVSFTMDAWFGSDVGLSAPCPSATERRSLCSARMHRVRFTLYRCT